MPTREEVVAAVKRNGGNKAEAARELGVSRGTVWHHTKDDEPVQKEPESVTQRKLRKAEQEVEKLKRELTDEQKRREVAEQDLEEALERDAIIQDLDEREIVARELAQYTRKRSTKGGCTAIICANDWHLEKQIKPSTVSGLNEFNLDIARRRIDRLWEKAVYLTEFFRNIADVDETILWCGGDMINNYLHDEDVEGNFCGPAEAIGLVEDHIATGIDHIVPDRVICNYGNHGRSTRRNRPATGWKTSWEYIAYEHLRKTYDIPFQIAQGYLSYTDVQGYKVRFHHGENVKYYGGVGGLTIPMNKAVQQWDKSRRADLTINGHFHQYLDYWSWVSCGCLCGFDAYAQSIKAEFQEPTQTIIFVDKTRGKVLSCPIFVEKPGDFA